MTAGNGAIGQPTNTNVKMKKRDDTRTIRGTAVSVANRNVLTGEAQTDDCEKQ